MLSYLLYRYYTLKEDSIIMIMNYNYGDDDDLSL